MEAQIESRDDLVAQVEEAQAGMPLMLQPWHEYVHLFLAGSPSYDIARLNLACAFGVPGAEDMDVGLCIRTTDGWAEGVRWHTSKLLRHFEKNPGEYHFSQAYFRAICLVTTLQRDFGVRYNPAIEFSDAPLTPPDSFLFGIIQKDGGTCATLPILYVAVGRRLGYPLYLVEVKGRTAWHLFVRWDDPHGERLNIEASGRGMTCPSDDYYRNEFCCVRPDDEAKGQLLQSLTPARELAAFLTQRRIHLDNVGEYRQGVTALAWASALTPNNVLYRNMLFSSLRIWRWQLMKRLPKDFPRVVVTSSHRRFPESFPLELERDILALEAFDNLLNDKEPAQKWWELMRRGEPVAPRPVQANVRFHAEGCNVDLICQ